ncbi:hypothetical protein L1987_77729 [Smallanthus sonchifolius]|uniref:Uncharacterized protein n=1 Tax=Smallanthus sonchifolius TaxID=185202 RepID=A0ACB8ZBP9_9ASTR|nr:hypothetical protein L1987_77729 [Smallanthus sonchifolius]
MNVNLWLAFMAFLICNCLVIWAIEVMDQESKSTSSQGIGTIFWLIILTIFSAKKEKLASNLSRFVLFVWLIMVLILITSYTATLTSLLTIEQFEAASKGGIVGIHEGGKHGGADAIVDEVPYIKMFLSKYSNGDSAMVPSEPVTSGFGFIFAKGSPLVADMSREIAKIREDGTLKNLEKKWFDTEFPVLPQNSSPKTKIISLESCSGMKFNGYYMASLA